MCKTSILCYLPDLHFSSEISLIKEEIGKVITKIKAAGLLRLVFHDAGTFDQGDETGITSSISSLTRACLASSASELKCVEMLK